MSRKGIILSGGSGTRLKPLTDVVSKQLLPVYDKPMIFYPLTVLMLAGIREILVITTPHDQASFKALLGNGRQWGIDLHYTIQDNPEGLAQAYILAEEFLDSCSSAMILGDNIFYGHGLRELLSSVQENEQATVFGYHVSDPQRYGVLGFDNEGNVTSITEKPLEPLSNYAVTGLYFLDADAPKLSKRVKMSERGELEITSLLQLYLEKKSLTVKTLGRGFAWLDTGTFASLLDASNFVRALTERQGLKVGDPWEVSVSMGFTS